MSRARSVALVGLTPYAGERCYGCGRRVEGDGSEGLTICERCWRDRKGPVEEGYDDEHDGGRLTDADGRL